MRLFSFSNIVYSLLSIAVYINMPLFASKHARTLSRWNLDKKTGPLESDQSPKSGSDEEGTNGIDKLQLRLQRREQVISAQKQQLNDQNDKISKLKKDLQETQNLLLNAESTLQKNEVEMQKQEQIAQYYKDELIKSSEQGSNNNAQSDNDIAGQVKVNQFLMTHKKRNEQIVSTLEKRLKDQGELLIKVQQENQGLKKDNQKLKNANQDLRQKALGTIQDLQTKCNKKLNQYKDEFKILNTSYNKQIDTIDKYEQELKDKDLYIRQLQNDIGLQNSEVSVSNSFNRNSVLRRHTIFDLSEMQSQGLDEDIANASNLSDDDSNFDDDNLDVDNDVSSDSSEIPDISDIEIFEDSQEMLPFTEPKESDSDNNAFNDPLIKITSSQPDQTTPSDSDMLTLQSHPVSTMPSNENQSEDYDAMKAYYLRIIYILSPAFLVSSLLNCWFYMARHRKKNEKKKNAYSIAKPKYVYTSFVFPS